MRSVRLIYFSPTGTTRKVLEAIARGFAADDPERTTCRERKEPQFFIS